MADRLFPVIQVGQVYLISRGSLKAANKRFSSVRNEYEINLDNNSQVLQVRPRAPRHGSKPAAGAAHEIRVAIRMGGRHALSDQRRERPADPVPFRAHRPD